MSRIKTIFFFLPLQTMDNFRNWESYTNFETWSKDKKLEWF
jgi:hypothetical protein